MPKKEQEHQSVLLEAVLAYLDPQEGESYLDLTAGYGGHASSVIERTKHPSAAVLVDRDEQAIRYLKAQPQLAGADVVHSDYLKASEGQMSKYKSFDLVLADLGVSSPHLNTASRGFSINRDGPLDMRMDSQQSLTAAELVNQANQADLEDILRLYGEEHRAHAIVRAIIAARPLITTKQLADIIKSLPGQKGGRKRIHPATKTFQALRIAVNDELGQLEKALPLWMSLLAPSGRIAVISFHSLEDRLVKLAFASQSGNLYDSTLELLTKSPVTATNKEIVQNPRARSAKLRAAVKINKKGDR